MRETEPMSMPPSRSAHYDIAFSELAIRNTARFNPPGLPLDDGELDERSARSKFQERSEDQLQLTHGLDTCQPVSGHQPSL